MKPLYDYLMNPKSTVQLYSHQKNWKLWWLILSIGGFLSMIKWSTMGLSSFISASLINVCFLIVFATIIDASAQLFGQPGKLTTVLYWLGFNQSILWLMPSLTIIQNTLLTLGSGLIFGLNLVYLVYLWISLKQVYKQSTPTMIGILVGPIIIGVIGLVAAVVWVTTQAMVMA
ncbi:MAG: hypothetical protein VW397_02290 [Candidatus Margulisiibacteriota bacterium]